MHYVLLYHTDVQGRHNRYALVQYWFDGPQIDIKVKPHGNSKSSHPYFRTAASAIAQHKAIASSNTPKSAIQIASKQQGGELEARGLNKLPRNVDQMKNYRRSEAKKDSDVLYSVMLQCKLSEGKTDAFVRDVKAAPEPQCILFTDWQLSDLFRFTTKPMEFCILTADTTYNLGDFYVTPTTYQHLLLENTVTGKHPYFLGPVLVHQRKNFSAFNYLASTLIGFSKKLKDVQAFGTDGDPALIEALSHNFHSAKQLRCFIHLKKNIAEKLRDRGIPSSEAQEFLADIFGKRSGNTHQEGLVDSENGDDFDARLDSCEAVWLTRERMYAREGQVTFFEYFKMHYSNVIRSTMLKDLRTFAGLGSPPGIFTTNGCESLNAVIKRKVEYKATEWPEFNNQLKQIVDGQRDEAIRSLSGRGQYRLCEQYQYLQVHPQAWIKMTPAQRCAVVKQFDDTSLRRSMSTSYEDTTSNESNAMSKSNMSVTSEHCSITSLPQATLNSIWAKALEYVTSSTDVVPAPGGDSKAKMVSSRSNNSPHYVRALTSGQYVCDSSCLQWKSSQICAHTVAVSESNSDLQSFLDWYIASKQQPNYTSLATHGLPAGRGRKGGVPKRQRSKAQPRTQVTVRRPATCFGRFDDVNYNRAPPSASCLSQSVSQTSSVSDIGVRSSCLPQSPLQANAGPSRLQSPLPESHLTAVSYSNTQSASHLTSVGSSAPVLTQNQTITIHPSYPGPSQSNQSLSTNPFFLRFVQGNIRVCQGCRSSLRTVDGCVPKAPFDLAVARFERRSFRDKNGELHTPAREQAVHYHLKPSCIQVVAPNFVLSNVLIPADVRPLLTSVHKEYLRLMFSVQAI